jgi:uncharacterized protein
VRHRLWRQGPERSHQLSFDPGEEVIEGLTSFANHEGIEVATITAVGGFDEATLGFYDVKSKSVYQIPLEAEQMEVLSFMGDITTEDGAKRVHVHVVLGRRDGTTRGGHVMRAVVNPMFVATLEELSGGIEPHHH